jgi:two-component system chemotaxis family response regulator WspR
VLRVFSFASEQIMSESTAAISALSGEYRTMVMLVDDQAMIGEAVRRALMDQPGIHFHYCDNAAEAVRIAEQVRPTVILQDLVMPNASGLDLLREYRSHAALRDVPVVVLSSEEEPAIKSEAFSLGANDYLVKLPDQVELVARVRYHSKAYTNQIQRDEVFHALRESQRQLVEKNLALERLTHVDGLTGLSNRRYLDQFLDNQWRYAIRKSLWLAVLMIDVDEFKRYNDGYGHLAGDEVLKKVAAIVQRYSQRATDLAARFGGEEFLLVMLPDPAEAAAQVAERLRQDVEQAGIAHAFASDRGVVTVSVGGAQCIPKREDSYLDLIKKADEALYQAKHLGRNRAVVVGG